MTRKYRNILFTFFTALVLIVVVSQKTTGQQLLRPVTNDTIATSSSEPDTTEVDSVYIPEHSPQKAALYSAIFPGLGQIYNKKYWKLPIIYAGFGVLAYFIIDNSNNYTHWHNAYVAFVNNDVTNESKYINSNYLHQNLPSYDPTYLSSVLKSGNDYYRRYRDMDYIIAGGAFMLVIIDAIVDAHFYEFNVNDDLSMKIQPVKMNIANNKSFGINMNLTFDSNKLFKKKNKLILYSSK